MKYLDGYDKMFEKVETEKVDFDWNGMKFKNIKLQPWGNGSYYVGIGAVSQVVRQYIKQKYKVPFQISSDSFADGDSIRTYFSPEDVTKEKFDEIRDDLNLMFSDGKFDGMEDIYNYGDNKFVVNLKGEDVSFGTKYITSEYRPKYDTKKYDQWREKNPDS